MTDRVTSQRTRARPSQAFLKAPLAWRVINRRVPTRRARARLGAFGLFCLAACTSEPRRESLNHGRFEHLQLSIPDSPRSLALVLAGPSEAPLADSLTRELSKEGALVTRVDAEAFQRLLDSTPSGCVFPSGDLDNLAHFIQAYLKLPSYQPAILIGLGVGAGLAAAAIQQAPPGTFAGAITYDYCGGVPLTVPVCPRGGRSASESSPPAPSPTDPLFALRSSPTISCPRGTPAPYAAPARDGPRFRETFASLAAAASSRATSTPTDLLDMPIVEVPAEGTENGDVFAIFLSGDGGWAGLDKEISENLAERGLPVVGIDSLRYFWRERTPESTAADLDRVIRRYQSSSRRARVLLLGYSQGADVLPFILNRLPAKTRASIAATVALSLSTTATFEFHVSNWVGASGDRPTLPEVQRLAPHSLVCVYGKEDDESLCPELDPNVFRVIELPGDHHFNDDYDRLSTIALEALHPI
jgi:type IV secretory pathway VirJ component